jgi:hypothetical protein
MRVLLLHEPLPASLDTLSFMTDTGIEISDLAQAFDQPNEFIESVSRLVITEGLVGSGAASRVSAFSVGPRVGDSRTISIEWIPYRRYTNVDPGRRHVEGKWLPTRP